MAAPWEQYAQPSGPWAKYSQQPQEAPAPTSGPIGAKVPVPAGLTGKPTPAENNRVALSNGLIGMGKSVADTMQTIHNNNYSPNSPTFTPSPMAPALTMDTKAKNPDEMAGKVFGGLAQMAVPLGEAKAVLPSAERAGAKLSDFATQLKGVPVSLTNTAPALQRTAELSARGGGPMGATGNLLQRSQSPIPMDFPEARDYYSNVSRLTSLDKQGMSGPLQRQIGKVRQAFHGDLADTAGRILPPTETGYLGQPMNGGKVDYENAVSEYGQAKRLGDLAKKAAVGGAGLLGAGGAYRKIRQLVGK